MSPIIDVHVNLSRWPFRRLPEDEPQRLVAKLHAHGVERALASTFDGLLHLDLAAANRRLVAECEQFGQEILTPVGAVNLSLPNWEADVAYCAQTPSVRGVRLWPGYHDISLDDPRFADLCARCEAEHLLLQIVLRLEDSRTEHPNFTSQAVGLKPLPDILKNHPALKVVLINPGRDVPAAVAAQFATVGQIYFEIGMIEGTGGLEKYLQQVPPERMLFGSHLPFFYFEAATLRLQESQPGDRITRLITYENARRLLDE